MSDDSIRITFVRHGQTESNLSRRWQGQGDSPLSALGVAQARLLGARLAQRKYTRVVSSDLSRAVDTARATGFHFSTDPALREFDIGRWEGLTGEQVAAQYPEELERLRRGEDVPLGGGESYVAFSARIDAALAGLRAGLSPGDHALVVCHGGVIGTALSGALGTRKARSWSSARPANTSITELSYSAESTTLHVFNDTLHLLPLGSWPGHGESMASVALLCEVEDEHGFGEFAARYEHVPYGGGEAEQAAADAGLSLQVSELLLRHPEQRIALRAPSDRIHAWAEATLLGSPEVRPSASGGSEPKGRLARPSAGSLSHAARVGERALLLDYGLMR